MARVFVTRRLPGPALERLEQAHDVEIWGERLPPRPEELRAHAKDAEGLLTLLTDRVDAQLLDASPRLRAVSNYAVGYDNVDLDTATNHGIRVGHTPDVLTDATADMAFTLLLAAARKLPEAIRAAAEGDWVTWEPARHLGREVYGQTLGIIGFGRIGRAVAKRAEGFDMKVIPVGPDEPLDGVLSDSDFVSLHAPLSPQTRHLINEIALDRMKRTAILVNTARGGIVDQDALLDALHRGTIAGAALDVTDPEPLPAGHPLLSAPNLIITPHVASATQAARERMTELAVENLLAALDGKPMPHQAN